MKIAVFSDLHILSDNDPFYSVFLRTLRREFKRGDRVILAGDIFDLFVGKKSLFRSRYRELIDLLGQLDQRGISVGIIDGNHDFYFADATQNDRFEVQDSVITFTCAGKRFYIAHGDLVDEEDRAYLFLRKVLRSVGGRLVFSALPDRFVDLLGQRASDYGKVARPRLPQDWKRDDLEKLRSKFHRFAKNQIEQGFDFVVLGHCHDLDERVFDINGRSGQYINMGYPKVHETYLQWTPESQNFVRTKFDFE